MKKLCLALILCASSAGAEPFQFFYANWSDHAMTHLTIYRLKANGKRARTPLWASGATMPGHIEPVIALPGYRCGRVEVDVTYDDGGKMTARADLCASPNLHISYYP